MRGKWESWTSDMRYEGSAVLGICGDGLPLPSQLHTQQGKRNLAEYLWLPELVPPPPADAGSCAMVRALHG
eukprot:7810853-Pyramimonas_sp.AAC.1